MLSLTKKQTLRIICCLVTFLIIGIVLWKLSNILNNSNLGQQGANLKEYSTLTVEGEGSVEYTSSQTLVRVQIEKTGSSLTLVKIQLKNVANTVVKALKDIVDSKFIHFNGINTGRTYWQKDYKYYGRYVLEIRPIDRDTAKKVYNALEDLDDVKVEIYDYNDAEALKSLKEQAVLKAIEDAKRKAELYAQNLGVKIVKVKEFEVFDGREVMPLYLRAQEGEAPAEIPLPTNKQKVSARVRVVFVAE